MRIYIYTHIHVFNLQGKLRSPSLLLKMWSKGTGQSSFYQDDFVHPSEKGPCTLNKPRYGGLWRIIDKVFLSSVELVNSPLLLEAKAKSFPCPIR